MRKFLIVLSVLLIASFPLMGQNSDPTDVTATATVESGCVLVISDIAVSWVLSIPMTPAEEDIFVPMDTPAAPINLDIFGRMNTTGSHRGQLMLTTTSFTLGGTPVNFPGELIKFTFTADGGFPAQEFMAPNVGIPMELWTSIDSTFSVHPTMVISFKNTLSRWGGEYVGVFTFIVQDVIV